MKPKIQRHGEILSLVRRHQFMSVDELAAALDVTPQTIRRDIRELEEVGSLKRHHGGASSGGNLPEGLPADRQTRCQNEKNAIARLIAEHIPDGSSLFVSIGTTMEAVVSELVRRRGSLRVITNNIHAASIASARTRLLRRGRIIRSSSLPESSALWTAVLPAWQPSILSTSSKSIMP